MNNDFTVSKIIKKITKQGIKYDKKQLVKICRF